jgi:hypothetical protein
LGVILGGFTVRDVYDPVRMLGEMIAALLLVGVVHLTGRILGGKGDFSTTLRTVGFAYTTRLYTLLVFLPFVGDLAKLITFILSIIAVWVAGVQAHRLKGWRSLIFPVAVAIVFIAVIFGLQILIGGAEFTYQTLFGG